MWFLLVMILLLGGLAFWMWKRPDPVKRDQNNLQSDLWLEQMEAQLAYASELMDGGQSDQDYEKAYQIFSELGQKHELPDAFIDMATMHLNGMGRPQNTETAVALLEKAYRLGSDDAAYRLGIVHDDESYGVLNQEKAIYWYQHAIARGNQDAQFQMASKYLEGNGVEEDQAKAFSILQNNAEQGHATSQYVLGVHFCAEGEEQDQVRGHQYLLQAAENGNVDASLMLADHYTHGTGVPQNEAMAYRFIKASMDQGSEQYAYSYYLLVLRGMLDKGRQTEIVNLLEQKAEQNDAKAQSLLGTAYFNGWGVPVHERKGFEYWTEAANQQDDIALCSIASLYFEGRLVAKNVQKAFSIYQHVNSKSGHQCARMGLAICYLLGEGTTQDTALAKQMIAETAEGFIGHPVESQADMYFALGLYYSSDTVPVKSGLRTRQYLEYAFMSGSSEAAYQLACNYLDGLGGVEQDDAQAFKWYQQGADQGHLQCKSQLGTLYLMGRGTEQNYAQALHWLQQAADEQESMAINNLAEMYEKGWGVEKDLDRAVRMYHQAADMNEPEACYQLGRLYLQGEGVVRNMKEARSWLDKARALGFEKAEQLYQRLDEYF